MANVRLLFSDTDSLCYHLFTDDVYRDMLDGRHLLDTSGYPESHSIFHCKHKGHRENER
jgi:hypothetical protein